MVDKPTPKTPDEIEKELSVENFTRQQARTLGFQFGGMALGGLAGFGLFKAGVGKSLEKYTMVRALGGVKGSLIAAGTLVGSVIGGVASLYEHWVKVEREQLSVQEINKDVAHIMEKRVQFEDTLDKQHALIQQMLEKQNAQGGKAADRITSRREAAAQETQRT
ncbi:MAG: hypothetical protein K2Q01_01090 [Rickettsiales bacterium]|nr:hypothetical protein [Rickettsiales bacterium]